MSPSIGPSVDTICSSQRAGIVLEVSSLTAGYSAADVLDGVSITVGEGEVVAILGPNGAGKTTLLITVAGILPVRTGRITYLDQPLRGPIHRRARQGIAYIPETRAVFRALSVRKNLELGMGEPEEALELFPELEPLLDRQAGLLSGGEQQMVSLGRALVSKPRLLLLDELSLGLAPIVVDRLLERIKLASSGGTSVLIIEQQARKVLGVADRAYVLRRGTVEVSGTGAELLADLARIESTYLAARTRDR